MKPPNKNVIEIPKLSMQEQVDTCQALLEMDELQREGLIEGFGSVDRLKCLALLAKAQRSGFVPTEQHYAIGRAFLERIGGRFTV